MIAARADLPADVRERVVSGLAKLGRDPAGKELVRHVFGADELRRPALDGYEKLRRAVAEAHEEGLLEVTEEPETNEPTVPRPRPRSSRR